MLIYNVTTKIAAAVAQDWLQWMQEEHIPAVMATGCFTGHTLVRLLEQDDSEGPTYATQYTAASEADYAAYMERHAVVLRDAAFRRWGHNFISFRSLMEVVASNKIA